MSLNMDEFIQLKKNLHLWLKRQPHPVPCCLLRRKAEFRTWQKNGSLGDRLVIGTIMLSCPKGAKHALLACSLAVLNGRVWPPVGVEDQGRIGLAL